MATKPEPTPITNPQLEDAIRELAANRMDQKALKARETDLVKIITTELEPGQYTSISNDLTISEPRRTLDKAALEAAYPYNEANAFMYGTVLDTGAVKNAIAANSLEQFYKAGASTVTVK